MITIYVIRELEKRNKVWDLCASIENFIFITMQSDQVQLQNLHWKFSQLSLPVEDISTKLEKIVQNDFMSVF